MDFFINNNIDIFSSRKSTIHGISKCSILALYLSKKSYTKKNIVINKKLNDYLLNNVKESLKILKNDKFFSESHVQYSVKGKKINRQQYVAMLEQHMLTNQLKELIGNGNKINKTRVSKF